MKSMKTISISLLVLSGALLGARGEEYRTDINPALLYYRALLATPAYLSDADQNYLESKKGREQKLPDRFGPIVAESDNLFQLVHQAAHATVPCDWGIDLNVGPNAILPHLGRLKALSQTAQLRARWALEHGRQADARDELLTAFVMGRQAASDGLLISTAVQFAMEGINYGTVAQHFGKFSPETLKQLVDGFDAAPARHTVAACMPTEKGLGDWTVRKLMELRKAYPGDDAKVMAGFRQSGVVTIFEFVGDTNFWPRLLSASGGTSDGTRKLLDESTSFFPRIARIMELPPAEYEAQAKELRAEINASPNPFVNMFKLILGWQNWQFRPREFRCQAQSAMVHAAVEYKLHGEAGFKSVMDPFGNGPFAFRRFVFKGVDRGFELKSACAGPEAPFVMIFVEKPGAAFQVSGPDAGKAIAQ